MSDPITNAVLSGSLAAIRRASARYEGHRESAMLDDLSAGLEREFSAPDDDDDPPPSAPAAQALAA